MFWSWFSPMTISGVFSSPTKMIGAVAAAGWNSLTVSGTRLCLAAKAKGPSIRFTPIPLWVAGFRGSGLE